MSVYLLLALLIGVVAGLRAMTAPAAVAWAAYLGWLELGGGGLAYLGQAWVRWILTALALVELVTDQLPSTPSRTVPVQFGARMVTGALCGAAVGAGAGGSWVGGLLAGAVGAAILGVGGDEAIHGVLDIMNAGVPYDVLERAMPIHPTVSEHIPTMLGEMRPAR